MSNTDVPTETPVPTPTSEITPLPDGYTLNLYTEGADYPIPINYWGDLSGRDTTPFSIYSDTPYRIDMEAGIIDIKEDFTSGYYLWTWDAHSYFGYDSTIWGDPVELKSFTVYTSEPVAEMKLMYANYDDPVVLPTPLPTPLGTSRPTYAPGQITFVDYETGEQIPDSDITVNLIYYDNFSVSQTWNSSQIILVDDLGIRKLLQAIATGYHELVTFSSYYTGTGSATISLYKETYATPEPENTPVSLLRATPTPPPNTAPAWNYHGSHR